MKKAIALLLTLLLVFGLCACGGNATDGDTATTTTAEPGVTTTTATAAEGDTTTTTASPTFVVEDDAVFNDAELSWN